MMKTYWLLEREGFGFFLNINLSWQNLSIGVGWRSRREDEDLVTEITLFLLYVRFTLIVVRRNARS